MTLASSHSRDDALFQTIAFAHMIQILPDPQHGGVRVRAVDLLTDEELVDVHTVTIKGAENTVVELCDRLCKASLKKALG